MFKNFLRKLRRPRFEIVADTETELVIRDTGNRDIHPGVSELPGSVVESLSASLHGRRLELLESDGTRTWIVVRHGRFSGFAMSDPFHRRGFRVVP